LMQVQAFDQKQREARAGQAAIEFLAMMAMGIVMLSIALFMYSSYWDAAGQTRTALEAQSLCSRTANIIAGVGALGDGGSAALGTRKAMAEGNYTVFVVGNHSLVRVDYLSGGKKAGFSCQFPKAEAWQAPSGNSTFALRGNETIENKGGGLVFGQ
jgi:hypothetical protein